MALKKERMVKMSINGGRYFIISLTDAYKIDEILANTKLPEGEGISWVKII